MNICIHNVNVQNFMLNFMEGAVQFLNGAACCSRLVLHFHVYKETQSSLNQFLLLFYAIVLLFENCTCIWYMYKHGSFLRADFKFKHICGVIDLIIFQNLGLYLQCIHSEYMTCELKSGNSQSASFTNSFISIKQL